MKKIKLRIKTIALITLHLALLIIPKIGSAQEINGIVKSKTSTIYFENFGAKNSLFNGEIHSNVSGSKYTFDLRNKDEKLDGIITDKFSRFDVDLSYKSDKIEGEIKRSTNGTKDKWDIQFLGQHLSGTVFHNALNTEDTYDLSYGDRIIKGTISKKLNALIYDLTFDKKKVSGSMSFNITTVKHSYNLMAQSLTADELDVLLFIESIKLINERIADIDDFQGNE